MKWSLLLLTTAAALNCLVGVATLAPRIAGDDGTLDAAVIGSAEALLHERPEEWRDWGSHAEALQHLKQLWHVLILYGFPAPRPDFAASIGD